MKNLIIHWHKLSLLKTIFKSSSYSNITLCSIDFMISRTFNLAPWYLIFDYVVAFALSFINNELL